MGNQVLFVGGKRYLVVQVADGKVLLEEIAEGFPVPLPKPSE